MRSEIRAAALFGLRSNPTWLSDAIGAAQLNVEPRSPELLLETVHLRIAAISHTKEDLEKLFWAWEAGIDYWLRDSLYEGILSGWKGSTELRALLEEKYIDDDQRSDREQVLSLLAESNPGDLKIAKLVAAEFSDRQGMGLDRDTLWTALVKGFKGNSVVAPVLWVAITKLMRENKRIVWHPAITPAFIVVGTDAARDALINAYLEADDGMERYWIGKTLIDGWLHDPVAKKSLETWVAHPDPKVSAPLANWISKFLSKTSQIREWLITRAKSARRDVATDTIYKLLNEFPDEEVLALCEQRLKDDKIWYYKRVALEATLAAATPRTSFAESVFERSLAQIDGPPIGKLVAVAESSPEWRAKILAAASPTVLGARQAIASVFRDRVAPDDVLSSSMPAHMAEVSGPVRTTILCALAVVSSNRTDPKHAALVTQLQEELQASGTYYESRRLSAVAAMAELGRFDLAVAAPTHKERGLGSMLSTMHPDPVAIQTLISHLSSLEAASLQSGQPFQFGSVDELIRHPGMLDALASEPHFAAVVDERLRGPVPQWDGSSFLELAAARLNSGDLLLQKLLDSIAGNLRNYSTSATAAKLLASHFGGRQDVWDQIRPALLKNVAFAEGIIGHLALAWPSELPFLSSLRPTHSPLDELVFRSLKGNFTGAKESLIDVLQRHHPHFWLYLRVGQSILVEWAALPVARTILGELTLDQNGTKSMMSIEILSRVGATSALPLEEIKKRFLDEISGTQFPREGFDIFTARYKSWCSGVFATLYGTTRQVSPGLHTLT